MSEKVLIIKPDCPACEAVQQHLAKKGVLQNYHVVDVSTPEGRDFAMRLGVRAAPECAIIEGSGSQKTVRVCSDDEWRRMLQGE